MGSHLGAIGLSSDQIPFSERVRQIMSASEPMGTSADGRLRLYRYLDPSGSYLTATIEDDRLTCMTPGIRPGLVVSGSCGVLNASECDYERPLELHADLGHVEVPLPITIDDLGLSEQRFVAGQQVSVEVSAMAERITFFPDEAAYRASGTPMAVESLIPAGLFAVGEPEGVAHEVTSRILLSGTVATAELRRHAMLGLPFALIGVRSLGGTWPVAVEVADLGEGGSSLPLPDSIVSATCWISGHLADPFPDAARA